MAKGSTDILQKTTIPREPWAARKAELPGSVSELVSSGFGPWEKWYGHMNEEADTCPPHRGDRTLGEQKHRLMNKGSHRITERMFWVGCGWNEEVGICRGPVEDLAVAGYSCYWWWGFSLAQAHRGFLGFRKAWDKGELCRGERHD